MKTLYVVPGKMSQTELGSAELGRRQSILQSYAGQQNQVDIVDIAEGPTSIESAYEEYLSIPGAVAAVIDAEKSGYDGVILGCFGDPGIDAIREMVKIPVVGPGETSVMVASLLGLRLSIITVMDSVIPSLEKLALSVVADKKLASVRAINTPVLELRKDPEATLLKLLDAAKLAIDQERADVIVLGCMSMAFMEISSQMQKTLGIPVVNPAVVALKVLEGWIVSQLTHSKAAYPYPPKLNKKER